MPNPNSLEEIAEIHSLLENIKQEYTQGIRGVLQKNDPDLFRNIHSIPKLEKIQINRGLGLSAQNTNILKKSIQEFKAITGQKPLITRSKKAIAGFKIREDLNKSANRVMGVLNPVKVVITNYPEGQEEMLTAENNQEDESAGYRQIPFSREIYIEKEDFREEANKKFFRLKKPV